MICIVVSGAIAMALVFAPSFAFARGSESHGGIGKVVGGKTYLLDFFEAGIHANPITPDWKTLNQTTYRKVLARVENVFGDIEKFPTAIVASNLTAVWELDPVAGASLLKAMEMLSWRVIASGLKNTEDGSAITLAGGEVQLAVRNGQTVYFSKPEVSKLSSAHFAGLAIHEVVYATIRPDWVTPSSHDRVQPVNRVREITAYIFSRDLKRRGRNGLYAILGGAATDWHSPVWANGNPRDFGRIEKEVRIPDFYNRSSENPSHLKHLSDTHNSHVYSEAPSSISENGNQIGYNPAVMVELRQHASSRSVFIPIYKSWTSEERRAQFMRICSLQHERPYAAFSEFHENLELQFATVKNQQATYTYISHRRSFALSSSVSAGILTSTLCDDDYVAAQRWVESFMQRFSDWSVE